MIASQPLDTAFWGVSFRGVYTSGRVQFKPWTIDQAHRFNLFFAKVLGGEVMSTVISLLPSLRAHDGKRAELQQVSLLERADQVRDALIAAIHTPALFELLAGVEIAQSGNAVPLSEPSPDIAPAFGGAPIAPTQQAVMDLWLPLWGTDAGGVKVPREQALWNQCLASVWDLYKLVGAVLAENLFPLDHGQRALRDSLYQSQRGLRWVAHVTTYAGDTAEIMATVAQYLNPRQAPASAASRAASTASSPRPLVP